MWVISVRDQNIRREEKNNSCQFNDSFKLVFLNVNHATIRRVFFSLLFLFIAKGLTQGNALQTGTELRSCVKVEVVVLGSRP